MVKRDIVLFLKKRFCSGIGQRLLCGGGCGFKENEKDETKTRQERGEETN
jgi:hypothetical protein